MKIVFCDNRLGGLLGFRVDVIKHFMDNGHDVVLVTPKPASSWDRVGVLPTGCRLIEVDMQAAAVSPIGDLRLIQSYRKIFKTEKPDVVFCYTIKPNIYAAWAAKRYGARVVDMLAGLGYVFNGHRLPQLIGRMLYRWGLTRVDNVLVLNQSNYQYLLDHKFVSKHKLILLDGGEGVNMNYYSHKEEVFASEIRFLMVARILYDKGFREFVEAAHIVQERYPNVKFELLGAWDNGPTHVDAQEFQTMVSAGIIHYLGVSNDVPSIVQRDGVVMVLPSYYPEGLNRSLMEACAMGRPIITTPTPGCVETLAIDSTDIHFPYCRAKNGYLVETHNAQALATAMIRFIELPNEEKQQMGQASYEHAKAHFNVEKTIAVYNDLLSAKKRDNR